MSNPQETRATGQERNSQSLFLQLPRELRTEVYRELLLSEEHLFMEIIPMGGCHLGSWSHDLHPGILLTCKQVCDEAADVLYGENVFYAIPNSLDLDNRNTSRVRRASAFVIDHLLGDLTMFLNDHPNLTHLFLQFAEEAVETENILIAIEDALRGHHGLLHLEICVGNPVSPKFIDFCWRLYSFIRRNQTAGVGVRPEEGELYDTTACPFFLTVQNR